MPPDYVPNIEEIKAMMANAGGTNLAGQSMAGPVATGQSYAQSIAGGMPMSQVIAPGVSYSPEQSGGYTQADLDFLARGPAPVMLAAPTTGEVATIDDQMFSAPVGVPQPTPWIPGQTPFPGIGNLDFLKDLDFSNLPDFSKKDISEILKDYQDRQDIGEPEPIQSFFTEPTPAPSVVPTMPEIPSFLGTGESVATSFMPGGDSITDFLANLGVATDKESLIGKTLFGQTITPESFGGEETGKSSFLSAVPRPDLPIPNISGPFGFIGTSQKTKNPLPNNSITDFLANLGTAESILPAPTPVMPALTNIPQIPNFPIQQPMNFTGLPNIPASSVIQPRVEDIIAPIRTGSTRRLPQPGLFNLR
jgi:hypothetical protein